uniref:TPR_MLP1_2 domain-containing protein n=1 Tax=Steinernema glaseri TaxID=37863 RepID=A0A1I8AMC8_9BILA
MGDQRSESAKIAITQKTNCVTAAIFRARRPIEGRSRRDLGRSSEFRGFVWNSRVREMSGELSPSSMLIRSAMDESTSSQVPLAANSANSLDSNAIQLVDLRKQVAVLEQEIFDNNERMAEIERSARDLAVENGILKSNILAVEKDRTERIRLLHEAESLRDDLMARKNAAEEKVALLSNRATLFEGQVERMTHEKKYLTDELDSTKRSLKERLAEKCKLQMEIDQFQQAKHAIEYEKERWKTEKEVLLNSKSWYTKEIVDRDNTVATLRIQLGSMEAKYEAEKAHLIDERNAALSREEVSKETIDNLEKSIAELTQKLKGAYEERSRYLTDFDLEVQAKDRIISSLREQGEAAETENVLLREENNKNETLINECKIALVTSQDELNSQRDQFQKLLEEREKSIEELQAELERANELLKSNCSVSDQDIAEFSPSAAEAARLIRGKVSLTSIYHEHTKALSKIEELTQENKRLESYINEIIQEFQEKIPRFQEEREAFTRIQEACTDLDKQLSLAREERDLVEHHKSELQRELNFTKGRLEKFQIAHDEQTKR